MEKEQTKNQQEKNQQENQKKSQKLQWHPAFCSALRLELLEDAENLEFTDEFQLTEKPLQIDCTVVKVKKDCKIKNEIGKIFRKHNIFEYKSPKDELNIDTFYKAVALLRTEEDVKNILINKNGRIIRLEEFCRIGIVPVREKGVSMSNGKRAVTLAIIKQADENMDDMKQAIGGTMNYFQSVYPDIEFSVSRNQTELLDYTISNLQQNLSLGFLFICIVAVLFLGDVKSPFIIGLSMVVSIVICFLLFLFVQLMSLNIMSCPD